SAAGFSAAAELPRVANVERQPLEAQVKRLAQALDLLGVPLSAADQKALKAAYQEADDTRAVTAFQSVLDKHCLAGVKVTVSGNNKTALETIRGPAPAELSEQGWRVFLVKVDNPKGVEDVELRPVSPNALPLYQRSTGKPDPTVVSVGEVAKRFLDVQSFGGQPLL